MTDDLHRLGLKLKFVYSLSGLILSLACILAGALLGLSDVVGHTSFTASLLGLSTQLTGWSGFECRARPIRAAPRVIVFVVGIFMVFITRFRVVHISETWNGPNQTEPVTGDSPLRGGGGGAGFKNQFLHNKHGPF